MKTRLRLPALVFFGLSATLAVHAQQPDQAEIERLMEQARQLQQSMNSGDGANLQQLQQRALEMQACVGKIDQTELERLRTESEAVEADIRALCGAGQRDAAQARAVEFGQRVAATPELSELAGCSTMIGEMLPPITAVAVEEAADREHVCDVSRAAP
ncbi:MAG: hypothetical protein WD928_12245 [Gammaproteobacteria bacterium]